MVVYTESEYLLFIQVSKSEYAKHESKRDDLFNTLYSDEKGKKVSIMEHYCHLASKPVISRDQDQKIWANERIAYFYITTSNQKSSRDQVNILYRENYLYKLNGWNVLRQHFESTKD